MPIYPHSQHNKRFNIKANTWNMQYVTLELVIRVFDKIPQECFSYILRNRSVLEWVIDQYQVSEDKRSGIVSCPNREDDPEYIARLVGRLVTVSVETVRLVEELAQAVTIYGIE